MSAQPVTGWASVFLPQAEPLKNDRAKPYHQYHEDGIEDGKKEQSPRFGRFANLAI
jgi:hypothetical protein